MLLLTACHSAQDAPIPGSKAIACRLPGASGFATVCTAERSSSPDGTVITVRSPDGGFHRLLMMKDGSGVEAADGAEPVLVGSSGKNSIDVTAADTVYRLPAKITP